MLEKQVVANSLQPKKLIDLNMYSYKKQKKGAAANAAAPFR